MFDLNAIAFFWWSVLGRQRDIIGLRTIVLLEVTPQCSDCNLFYVVMEQGSGMGLTWSNHDPCVLILISSFCGS